MIPCFDNNRLDDLLQSCVQCGLCLPHCATYLATGSETQSPRGRLVLLGDVVHGKAALTPSIREAFDLCLGCRACETACPSGIEPALLEAARTMARSVMAPPSVVGLRLRPESLPWLSRAGAVGEMCLRILGGRSWRRRFADGALAPLARLIGTRPVSPQPSGELIRRLDGLTGLKTERDSLYAAPAPTTTATLFRGCVNGTLLSGTQSRLVELLSAGGVALEVPDHQTCCGALEAHGGDPAAAEVRRRRNSEALRGSVVKTGTLIVEAAGCGLELKASATVDPEHVVDAVVLLDQLVLPPRRRLELTVVVHDPCHARHGQGIVGEPRRLLAGIPALRIVEPEEADVCCGSGGGYALAHPELSASMGLRKARLLAASGADLVVTANPGCLGQVRDALATDGSDLEILPLTDLLWYACLS